MAINHSKKNSKKAGSLRIIGGTWRSRRLPVADVAGLRPTPDRVRETLFNWLAAQTTEARCLDLFSGTGALGLEALSRGASHVTFVERSASAASMLRHNLITLSCDRAAVVQADALTWSQRPPKQAYDLVFLDPPFHKGLLAPICRQLDETGYLAPGARLYAESESGLAAFGQGLPQHWSLLKEKRAGLVTSRLYRIDTKTPTAPLTRQ